MRAASGPCVIDSTAFFIRAAETGDEILVFGDVEPDSISIAPRNVRVWQDAAPKVASGLLKAIFIECSYDDSQPDETLYGHLAPRHLIEELATLAEHVRSARGELQDSQQQQAAAEAETMRKRKRRSDTVESDKRRGRAANRNSSLSAKHTASVSPAARSLHNNNSSNNNNNNTNDENNRTATTPAAPRYSSKSRDGGQRSLRPAPLNNSSRRSEREPPLAGLKVVIIHIKDTMQDSGHPSDLILEQLQEHEAGLGLGVEFVIPKAGGSMYF
jgi:hypothetical protein